MIPEIYSERRQDQQDQQEEMCSSNPQQTEKENDNNDKKGLLISIFVTAVFLGLLIIIGATVGASYQYVEPLTYALMKNANPGQSKVDQKTYTNGRYYVGPSRKQITFPSTAIQVDYWRGSQSGTVIVFTTSGLEVVVEVVFYYRLKKDSIYDIFTKYNKGIYNFVSSNALRAIKNAAVQFGVEDYITRREEIQEALYQALRAEMMNYPFIDFMGRDFFYLNSVVYPEQFVNTWLSASVQTQVVQKNDADRENAAVLSQTEVLKTEINTNITRINYQRDQQISQIMANATSYSDLVRNAQISVNTADIMRALNITSQADVDKFIRITAAMKDPRLVSGIPAEIRSMWMFGGLFGDKPFGGMYGQIDDANKKMLVGSGTPLVQV